MPRFSVFIATSLDGYIARADGGLDWLKLVEHPGEDYGFSAFFDTVDTLVMGRATYETVLGFGGDWPYAGKRVFVMTHHEMAPRHDEVFFGGSPGDLMQQLADSTRVYVDGGHVIRQFLAAGLIDDVTISMIPIVLGDGIRLFAGGEGEHGLELVEHRGWPTGLVQLTYRTRARRATRG